MKSARIGISVGDVNGIGLEVVLKTLSHSGILKQCVPIIYGSGKVVSYHKNLCRLEDFSYSTLRDHSDLQEGKVYVVNCWEEEVNVTLGQPTADGGLYAQKALDRATEDLKNNKIDALVTAPINKEAMKLSGWNYPGHTEYLTDKFDTKQSLMCLVNEDLRVATVTNHIPVGKITEHLNSKLIEDKIRIFNSALKKNFGIEKPVIAVLGLNPHAGDGGTIGSEEEETLKPLLHSLKDKGLLVHGPYAADGFFGSPTYKKFDGILAMYHDQGLIPFKVLSFGDGVNFTAGLPVIRTSPDHGTGYDIVGKNQASPDSFRKALYAAIDMVKQRELLEI